MAQKTVAILGATGVVGTQMLQCLEERDFPVGKLVPLASERSVGKTVTFRGEQVPVQLACPEAFEGVDIVLGAAGDAQAKELMPETPIGGEFQFDAAVSPAVAKTKHITDGVGGHANTFIFPDINAGNIGYKIAQRLGGFEAYGPILLGLNAPINDLSRGCNAQEVYSMAIITAALA